MITLVAVEETFEIVESPLHGHVKAVLQAMRRLGLPRLIDSRPSRERDLVVAMIAAAGGSGYPCNPARLFGPVLPLR